MSEGMSGWLWLAIDVGMVVVLGVVLVYGTLQWRKRRNAAAVAPEYKEAGRR